MIRRKIPSAARAAKSARQPLELAYYVYRDPAYAAVIKNGGGKRDLLYGVPELPTNTPERFRDSAFADNVGLAMLRSQTTNRPFASRSRPTLHYGTHGWAHGHFDRTDLLSLFRYGRNFWNPESVFWVYEPFMYKFYCQCSVNHNMVVVDRENAGGDAGRTAALPHRRRDAGDGRRDGGALEQSALRWDGL